MDDVKFRSAFEGIPQFDSIKGPVTLLRVADSLEPKPGKWWFEERLFWDVLDEITTVEKLSPGHMTYLIRTVVREELAVSHDWNRFRYFYRLALTHGTRLSAWQGRARFQPSYSMTARLEAAHHSRLRLLFGGGYQYYIPDVPGELVRGPFDFRVSRAGHA